MKTLITLTFFSLFFFSTTSAQDFHQLIAKGDSCFSKRELNQSISFYKEALNKKPERLITKENEIIVYSNLSYTYFELSEYQNALEFLFKYIDKVKTVGNDSILAITYNQIGRCYGNLGQNDQALKFYKKSEAKSAEGTKQKAASINNIADIYLQQKKYKEAKPYFIKAKEIFKKTNYFDGLVVTNINLASIELEEKKIETANNYLQEAKDLCIEKQDTFYLIITNVYLAKYYTQITNYEKAEQCLNWTLENSNKINTPQYISESYQGFVNLYEKMHNYKQAFKYLKLFKSVSDSIYNLNSSRDYADLEAKYSLKEKERENEALQQEQQFSEAQIKSQEKYTLVLSSLVIFIMLFVSLLVYQRVKRAKARKLLETQNKEISKSKKQLEDLNFQYEKLIAKYEGNDTDNKPSAKLT